MLLLPSWLPLGSFSSFLLVHMDQLYIRPQMVVTYNLKVITFYSFKVFTYKPEVITYNLK